MDSPTPSVFDDLPTVDFSPTNAYKNTQNSDNSSIDSLFDEPSYIPSNSRIPRQECNPQALPIYPAELHLPTSSSSGSIPGLFYDPVILISPDLETRVINECLRRWFVRPRNADTKMQPPFNLDFHNIGQIHEGSPPEGSIEWEFNDVNQVMLFNRTDGITSDSVDQSPNQGWPQCLTALLTHISLLLKPPVLDPRIWDILFSPAGSNKSATELGDNEPHRSRQAIINLYQAGEGISDHIDLLDRYDDGIIGVSFGTGCVMRFRRAHDHHCHTDECGHHHIDSENLSGESDNFAPDRRESSEKMFTEIYLPPRSILIMTGEARYKWTHGIQGTNADLVQSELPSSDAADRADVRLGRYLNDQLDTNGVQAREAERGVWFARGTRLSVTFRWLLPGADVVGSNQ
jgi:alkylated DNA repair dioxygenase AlkB